MFLKNGDSKGEKIMPNEVKPCPFCGEQPMLDRHDIFCDCGVELKIQPFVSGDKSIDGFPTYQEARQEMIDAWNRRVNNA